MGVGFFGGLALAALVADTAFDCGVAKEMATLAGAVAGTVLGPLPGALPVGLPACGAVKAYVARSKRAARKQQ